VVPRAAARHAPGGMQPRCWKRWLRRYAPAEIVALVTAAAGYLLVHAATENAGAAAYGATIGDNVGYYGMLALRELAAGRSLRGLAVEFGPAEALDSAVVRPACVALSTAALGPALGVLVAKVLADLAFYVPVITTYELRRR
jgi:hypothetical protein